MQMYMNAYSISRAYGGPEEGGWWYDEGAPVASMPLPDSAVESIEWIEGDDEPDEYGEYSAGFFTFDLTEQGREIRRQMAEDLRAMGYADIRVFAEAHFARAFPDRIPHYC